MKLRSLLKGLILTLILVFIALFLLIFSEFIFNYFKLLRCKWPKLNQSADNATSPINVMMLTDTHLLGSRKSAWVDRVMRDWLLYWSFQTAISVHDPEVVFLLGDVTDEGLFADDVEWERTMIRFNQIFHVPADMSMYIVIGNHDIGFHHEVTRKHWQRFNNDFFTDDARLISIRGVHFVTVNSIGLHEDECFMCKDTESKLDRIEEILRCSSPFADNSTCDDVEKLPDFSRPILIQHYPYYRTRDTVCQDFNRAAFPHIMERYRPKMDCLGYNASLKLLRRIQPRASFCGHTHSACTLPHMIGDGIEHTLSTFNRRMKPSPTLTLTVLDPESYVTQDCYLPTTSDVLIFAAILIIVIYMSFAVFLKLCIRRSELKIGNSRTQLYS